MENITARLQVQAERIPDEIAIIGEELRLTFKDVDDSIWRIGTYLKKNDIQSGSVVAILCHTELSIFIAMLALARLGATSVVMEEKSLEILSEEMGLFGINTVISDTDMDPALSHKNIILDIPLLVDENLPIDRGIFEYEPKAPVLITKGSGTTGIPKLIPITHNQLNARIEIINEMENMQCGDRIATFSDMQFTSTQFRSLAALYIGASAVLGLEQSVFSINKFQVTHLSALMYQLNGMAKKMNKSSKKLLPSLKSLSVGFATISTNSRQMIRDKLCENLYIGYGANECGAVSMTGISEKFNIAGTIGLPLSGIEVEIVDSNDQVLATGSIGNIRIKSPGMIDAYYNDPASTDKVFKEGWFYPNDLGKFSEDGQLIHMGRSDDMMILNGMNIYPTEIEHAMTAHSEVVDAVAIPMQSEIYQDIPICAVVISGGSSLTESELLDFSSQKLGLHAPKIICILEKIPRNEQGKLIRKVLIEKVNEQLSTSIENAIKKTKTISRKHTQLRQTASLTLQKDLSLDLTRIDYWMERVLKINSEPLSSNVSEDLRQKYNLSIQLIWRTLLLSKALLHVVKVPVFYTGEILDINDKHPEHHVIQIAFSYLDHIPKNVFMHAFKLASYIVLNFMKRPHNDENRQIIFEVIQKKFIIPESHVSRSGKSTMLILDVAYQKHIPFRHLGQGIYQLGWGSKARKINRSSSEFDSPIGSMMSHNKIITAQLLQDAGLPVAEHKVVMTQEEAEVAAKTLQWPLVVKPSDMDRGAGVTVDIVDNDLLYKAFKVAHDISKSKRICIEKQVDGACYRIFIADQKMLYAVKRLPKSVKGNGKNSVKELIEEANHRENSLPSWKRSEVFPFDTSAIEAMSLAGFTENSVPEAEKLVPLRRIASTQWGGVNEDVTGVIHPDNLDLALRAAKLFGLHVAGIDIVTSDISVPWYVNGAIVNEVNYSPQYGDEISKNTISRYLDDLVEDYGRISITVILGDSKAMDIAKSIQSKQVKNGLQTFITSHKQSIASSKEEIYLACTSLHMRCRALLLDARVDALVVVVQTDEFLQTGLPIDSIDTLMVDSENVYHHKNIEEKVSKKRFTQLLSLVKTIT